MIYIKEDSNYITIPKHTSIESDTYTVVLDSHLNNEYVLVDNSADYSLNPLFYKFKITEPIQLSVGEYEYRVYSTYSKMIEKGLLVFGDYNGCERVINNTHKKEKIQYERKN